MTRVYADMVADLFHYGHAEFLRKARELGDEMVVGVHSDATVESYKGSPIMTMQERIAAVSSCRYVDEVIPDAPLVVSAEWIEDHRLDLVVHGDDFSEQQLASYYRVPRERGIFRTVTYTPGISTSELVRRIVARSR